MQKMSGDFHALIPASFASFIQCFGCGRFAPARMWDA
jgi:hypothetical protein